MAQLQMPPSGLAPPGTTPFAATLVSQEETDSSGSFTGLRVTQARDLKTFIRSGLMVGDVISAVNGTKLDSDNGQEMLSALTHGTTVTVIRHNKAVDVTLDLTP